MRGRTVAIVAIGALAMLTFMGVRAIPEATIALQIDPTIVVDVGPGQSAAIAGGTIWITGMSTVDAESPEAADLYLAEGRQLVTITFVGEGLTSDVCFTQLEGMVDGVAGRWTSTSLYDASGCLAVGNGTGQASFEVPSGALTGARALTLPSGVVWYGLRV